MTGRAFIVRVRKLGRKRGVYVTVDSKRGKGSHIELRYGTRKTYVPDIRKRLPPGTLSGMIRHLGLNSKDFR